MSVREQEAAAVNVADEPFPSLPASSVLNPCQREGLTHYSCNIISRLRRRNTERTWHKVVEQLSEPDTLRIR